MEQQAETLTAVHGCACLVLCSCTSFSRCTRRWQERLPRQAYPGVLRAAASHGLHSFSRFNQTIESVKKRQMFLSFGNRHYCCLEPFWIGMYSALFTGTKLLWHSTKILFSLSNKHSLSGHFCDPPKTISKTSKSIQKLEARSQPMSGSYTSFSGISQELQFLFLFRRWRLYIFFKKELLYDGLDLSVWPTTTWKMMMKRSWNLMTSWHVHYISFIDIWCLKLSYMIYTPWTIPILYISILSSYINM